jgi:hypothetical protein
MNTLRAALVGATVAGATLFSLAGCTGTNLPTGLLPSPTGGTGGAPSTGGAACPNPAPTPAGGTSVGTSAMGDYNGKTLPNGWDSQYKTEADVTARISKFADDAKTGGAGSAAASTWESFKCIYQPAVAVWRTKSGRTD